MTLVFESLFTFFLIISNLIFSYIIWFLFISGIGIEYDEFRIKERVEAIVSRKVKLTTLARFNLLHGSMKLILNEMNLSRRFKDAILFLLPVNVYLMFEYYKNRTLSYDGYSFFLMSEFEESHRIENERKSLVNFKFRHGITVKVPSFKRLDTGLLLPLVVRYFVSLVKHSTRIIHTLAAVGDIILADYVVRRIIYEKGVFISKGYLAQRKAAMISNAHLDLCLRLKFNYDLGSKKMGGTVIEAVIGYLHMINEATVIRMLLSYIYSSCLFEPVMAKPNLIYEAVCDCERGNVAYTETRICNLGFRCKSCVSISRECCYGYFVLCDNLRCEFQVTKQIDSRRCTECDCMICQEDCKCRCSMLI